MRLIFDSSSIFRAIQTNRVRVLVEGYTLDLARYELGNILWKEHALYKRLTIGELEDLMNIVKDVLGLMRILRTDCHEKDILRLSVRMGITFYDASYCYFADRDQMVLVTEDRELIRNATEANIKAVTLDSLGSLPA